MTNATPLQRSLYEQELRDIYNTYMRQKDAIEAEVKARVEREIAAERGNMLVKLSETMHDYHRKGLPIAGIRRAVRKYNNTDAFNELWLAYKPEEDFTLAPGRNPVLPYRFEKFVYRGTERDAILWLKDKKGKALDTPLRAYVFWDQLDFPDLDRDQEDYRKSVGYGFEEFTRLTGAIIKEHYEGKEQE